MEGEVGWGGGHSVVFKAVRLDKAGGMGEPGKRDRHTSREREA
jgi:hypothetical protein